MTTTTSLSQRLAAAVGAAMLALLTAPGCQVPDADPGAKNGVPGASEDEALGQVSSESKVGGCTCVSKGSCGTLSYSDKPSNGTYYITTYGSATNPGTQGCSGMEKANTKWAYIADAARFGCGTKVKITANGKSCVAQVADCGPNRCVEQAAAGSCNSHFPIIDASPFITKHLFGVSGAGYSDKLTIQVEEVGASETVGCGTQTSGDGDDDDDDDGGSGGSSSGGGAGGTSGGEQRKTCSTDADCGGGDNKCDHNTTPGQCVERKEIGQACSDDKDCNGELEGTSRVCVNSKCADACKQNSDCPTGNDCVKRSGATTGKCVNNGSCVLDYPLVSIQGIAAPANFKQSYRNRGPCGSAPACVIDPNNVVDAKTRKKLSFKTVRLSEHFTLDELTGTSARERIPYVYIDPDFVKDLEATRVTYGKAITINSGFRSPTRQASVCRGACPGGASSCSGRCALCSDHMGGQAADTKHSSPKCALGKAACTGGKMHLIFNEGFNGDHLHIDIGPGNRTCTYKSMSCK